MSVDTVIARIVAREGGIADVGDGRGVTRYGQTSAWLQTFGYPVPTSPDEAAENYRRWLHDTGLEAVATVADVLADAVIDWAVHSGHQVAIRAMQAALGVTPDGIIGPITRGALARADRGTAAKQVVADRVRYVGRIVRRDPRAARFAAGWANRLAALVEAL